MGVFKWGSNMRDSICGQEYEYDYAGVSATATTTNLQRRYKKCSTGHVSVTKLEVLAN